MLPAISGIGSLRPVETRQEMLRTCRLLIPAGDIQEVRIPKTRWHGTISGYFDLPGATAEAALNCDATVTATYMTRNRRNPDPLANAKNRLQTRADDFGKYCEASCSSDLVIQACGGLKK